jgi:hypothetical protein
VSGVSGTLALDVPLDARRRTGLSVVCAVERTLASLEAARQAATFAAGGRLELIAVTGSEDLHPGGSHLAAARAIAARAGVSASIRHADPEFGIDDLLGLAAGYDLLVVGDRRDSGHASHLAGLAVRCSPLSVIVARKPARGAAVTDSIAVVPGDSADARAARTIAQTLVRHAGGRIVPPVGDDDAHDASDLLRTTRRTDPTLIVVAARESGRGRIDRFALTVAHRARCSVLVARARSKPPRTARTAAARIPRSRV